MRLITEDYLQFNDTPLSEYYTEPLSEWLWPSCISFVFPGWWIIPLGCICSWQVQVWLYPVPADQWSPVCAAMGGHTSSWLLIWNQWKHSCWFSDTGEAVCYSCAVYLTNNKNNRRNKNSRGNITGPLQSWEAGKSRNNWPAQTAQACCVINLCLSSVGCVIWQ